MCPDDFLLKDEKKLAGMQPPIKFGVSIIVIK